MRKTLYIVRGLPGSGKSTLAALLAPDANFAADDYFTDKDGVYHFDRALSPYAHADCKQRMVAAMRHEEEHIAIHNTFVESWEAEEYYRLAAYHGYEVHVVEAQGDFGNIHDVPQEIVMDMMRRWHKYLKPPRDYDTIRDAAAKRLQGVEGE
jgi:thymidylate kinase